MLDLFGDRQRALLRLLLKNKDGLTTDALASALDISRPAVSQHLMALERDGYVQRGEFRKTSGRPVQVYQLTETGHELFPRQYTWFSGVLLDAMRQERGSEGLEAWMNDLAGTIAKGLAGRVEGRDLASRIEATVGVMDELAYVAEAVPGDGLPVIEAANCVYHGLAKTYPEICQFDRALIGHLTGGTVTQEVCMAKGGGVCRFRIDAAAPRD